MGYPNFNLTTIQLPAPTSNMTKAEYKAAYGIDLDAVDVRSFKLVIYGNEKYSIDQIKDVEGGIEIYFNGRILSITDTVETSDEIYDVVNSKPLYFHPVYLRRSNADNTATLRASFFIINNSPTPFTSNTFNAYIKNLMDGGALIQANGCIETSGGNSNVFILSKVGTKYYLVSNTESTLDNIEYDTFTNDVSFADGVNKIN